MEDTVQSTNRVERALADLRASEERFRLLVQTVRDHAIFLMDPAGNVPSWNEGAQRILGYRSDEILGRPGAIFFPPTSSPAATSSASSPPPWPWDSPQRGDWSLPDSCKRYGPGKSACTRGVALYPRVELQSEFKPSRTLLPRGAGLR